MKGETKTYLMQTDELPHGCLCFPELNGFNTVSKCVSVGRREEKYNALLCSPALESICQCPAALHL